MNEELRAACMAEEGFEYVPLPFQGAIGSARFDETLDPDEFAAEYGLGISTLREEEELASAVNAATWVNPNEAITSVMAPEELLAYQVALYGPAAGDGSDSEDGSGYQPAEPGGGCAGKASVVYSGVNSLDLSDEAEAVMVNLEQAVEADAALQAAETEWSLCMRAEGYEVDVQSELVGLVEEWLLPVLARAGSKEVVVGDPQGGSITVIVPDIDRSDLAEVQRREIELALTDRRCDSSTRLSDTRARVRIDLQNRAISQYCDELRGSSGED